MQLLPKQTLGLPP